MEPWTATKKLLVSMVEPPAPVPVPSQSPLAPSVASVMSVANDKGDNEMILGAVHISPGICLTAEENFKLVCLLSNTVWFMLLRIRMMALVEKIGLMSGIHFLSGL